MGGQSLEEGSPPCSRDRQPKWPEDKKIYAGFGAALAILVLVSVSSYWTTIRVIDNANWAIHSHEIVREIADLNFRLYVAESSQRTALMTGRSGNADQYQQAMEGIRPDSEAVT